MSYRILQNSIEVYDTSDFDPRHILECGQTFRFQRTDKGYKIFSKNLKCDLIYDNQHVIMNTDYIEYFVDFFDLKTNYSKIKESLGDYEFLNDAIKHGKGIRILRQDPVEMIISFIISANNNIPRIKSTIQRLCQALGQKIDDGYAFPTLQALGSKNQDFYVSMGLGYRAGYIVDTVRKLLDGFDLDIIRQMPTNDAKRYLMGLKGIGQKVADCVLLFGFAKTDAFPTDVWIDRVYRQIYGEDGATRAHMADTLSKQFGVLSGYAQQYLYYYVRGGKSPNEK